jgi:hypothetical protein
VEHIAVLATLGKPVAADPKVEAVIMLFGIVFIALHWFSPRSEDAGAFNARDEFPASLMVTDASASLGDDSTPCLPIAISTSGYIVFFIFDLSTYPGSSITTSARAGVRLAPHQRFEIVGEVLLTSLLEIALFFWRRIVLAPQVAPSIRVAHFGPLVSKPLRLPLTPAFRALGLTSGQVA